MIEKYFLKQKRPVKYGEDITIYKFRTMTDERDNLGKLLPDEKRLTSVGKTLRSLSLDELPQLFNIICGDMSFPAVSSTTSCRVPKIIYARSNEKA